MSKFREGAADRWKWGAHEAEGKVAESFARDVTRTIKGEKVKRKASEKEPAYLHRSGRRRPRAESHSELEKDTK